MPYDLPTIIRQAKAKPRRFRRIEATYGLKADMTAPYAALVRAWRAEVERLVEVYAGARGNSDPQALESAIAAASARVSAALPDLQRQAFAAITGVERWHRSQWIRRIKASTGLDVTHMSAPDDVSAPTDQAKIWANQLLPSVHNETHARLTAALLAGLAALKPPAQVQADLNEILRKAQRRAVNIGVDQTDRTSAGMDRARRSAAGLGRFVWRHTAQLHPRVDHRARDGRRYSESNAPNDRAGTLPFCKCWEEPLFD